MLADGQYNHPPWPRTVGHPPHKKSRRSSGLTEQNSRVKVLVLAIDEARVLHEKGGSRGVKVIRLSRRAAKEANEELEERKMMIFVVLIDSNSQIPDLEKPFATDSSSRNAKPQAMKLFAPFVLTHTMDVMLNRGRSPQHPPYDYKESVLEHDADQVWDTLVSMGRPLWHNFASSPDTDSVGETLYLAASKLLRGLGP
ncbi:hypothetical protein PHYPSEUDO_000454, partial [Phytophthora pseudosyringae]